MKLRSTQALERMLLGLRFFIIRPFEAMQGEVRTIAEKVADQEKAAGPWFADRTDQAADREVSAWDALGTLSTG